MAEIDRRLLERLLDHWPVARFASLQPRDAGPPVPHQVPVVFCRVGDAVFSPLDGKTKSGRELQRFRNIRAYPETSLLLDDYHADWRRLWWVRLSGPADRYEPDPDTAALLAARMRAKYPQYANVPLHRAEPVYMRLTWSRADVWGQTNAHTAIADALDTIDTKGTTDD